MPTRPRLSAEDWAAAALAAFTTGGLAAVAIEPIATRLGATKGSFYWHFKDRAALVDAALSLWEERQTAAVISRLDGVPDPRERLHQLLILTAGPPDARDPVVVLFRDITDDRVRRVLERVTRRRVAYIQEQLVQLGMAPDAATQAAALGYATYLGWWQLLVTAPDLVAGESARTAYVEAVSRLLMAGD